MAEHRTISLTRDQAAFVDRLIESGRYGSVESVLWEGLDLLQQREAEHTARRQQIAKDLDRRAQEPTRPFDETTARLNAWRSQRDGDDAA
jgi:antitoxin ParD1/3/4